MLAASAARLRIKHLLFRTACLRRCFSLHYSQGRGSRCRRRFIVHQRSILRHGRLQSTSLHFSVSSDERRIFCVCVLLMSCPLLLLSSPTLAQVFYFWRGHSWSRSSLCVYRTLFSLPSRLGKDSPMGPFCVTFLDCQ
jgi:hypothetical protein